MSDIGQSTVFVSITNSYNHLPFLIEYPSIHVLNAVLVTGCSTVEGSEPVLMADATEVFIFTNKLSSKSSVVIVDGSVALVEAWVLPGRCIKSFP
jgi:hypothetical protein